MNIKFKNAKIIHFALILAVIATLGFFYYATRMLHNVPFVRVDSELLLAELSEKFHLNFNDMEEIQKEKYHAYNWDTKDSFYFIIKGVCESGKSESIFNLLPEEEKEFLFETKQEYAADFDFRPKIKKFPKWFKEKITKGENYTYRSLDVYIDTSNTDKDTVYIFGEYYIE